MKVLNLEGLTQYTTKLLEKIRSMMSAYIPLSGSTAITGVLRSYDEIQSTAPNAFRLANPKYGTIIRNDGDKTYFLLTNENDTYGSWNNLRPLSIVHSTGVVQFENGIEGNLSGHASSATSSTFMTGWSDNRNVNTTPNDYNGRLEVKGLKTNSKIGLSNNEIYSTVVGVRGWHDSTGGNAHELAFDGGGKIYHRHGSTDTWSSWQRFYTSENITYGTSGLTAGSSNLSTGSIYLQYE